MGSLHKNCIVKVSQEQALLILVCNVFMPGTGTIIGGFIAGEKHTVNNLIAGSL